MSRSDKFALATFLVLLVFSALMHLLLADNGDKGWLLLAARMWLDGHRLYVDLVEVNPPLILWLYGFVVWVSQHLPVFQDFEVLGFLGLLGSMLSVWLCTKLIRQHPEFMQDRRRQVEFSLLLAFIFIFLTPQSYFFDREHILLVMTFPYVLRFMPSLASQRLTLSTSSAVGLLAAFGFCIKPHSAILFIAVQLLFILRERSFSVLWSLENRIIAAAALGYFVCVWHFTPEYIFVILPMALETYSAFGRSGSSLLDLPPILLCAGLTFADFRFRFTSPYRSDIYYFMAISGAFLLHTVVSNGWDYTYYPLMSMLLFLSGLVFLEYQWLARTNEAQGLSYRQFVFGQRGCILSLATQGVYMAIVTFLAMEVIAIQIRCGHTPECSIQNPYVRYVRDHHVHSFGTITLDYPKWVTLVHYSGARWETRFNHLWMLPKLLQAAETTFADHEHIEQYVAGALAEDLNSKKPDIVFVDTGRQFFAYPRHVDLPEFLSQVPEFKAAWAHYHYSTTIDECSASGALFFRSGCKYDIFSRQIP